MANFVSRIFAYTITHAASIHSPRKYSNNARGTCNIIAGKLNTLSLKIAGLRFFLFGIRPIERMHVTSAISKIQK